MYLPVHLERHPFGRVPALQHDDFVLYETNAIAAYIDDVFPGPKLTPADPKQRARMNQWIGNLNWYFYPEMIYHISHERNVYPELGIPGNDLIVQRAIPKARRALEVMEKELSDGRPFLVGDTVTMADYFLLPTLFGFALTPEGKQLLPKFPSVVAWDNRMDALPSVVAFNAKLAAAGTNPARPRMGASPPSGRLGRHVRAFDSRPVSCRAAKRCLTLQRR